MRILLTVVLLASATSPCLAEDKKPDDKKADNKTLSNEEQRKATPVVKKLSEDLLSVAMSRDPKVLERVMAEDVLIVDPHGKVFTRAQEIELLKSGEFKADSAEMKTDDIQVKFYGTTAVVTGRSTVKAKFAGKDISGTYRFTQIFMDRGQGWQMVTCLSTPEQKVFPPPK